MALLFSPSLTGGDVSTDASFRATAQFIDDTLTRGGWLVTGDTGQTLPAALSHPTAASQKMGYRIYAMGDALAATNPVVMRIDFGGGSIPQIFAIWITIGTGSNGSGTITNILHNGGARAGGLAGSGNVAGNSYGSSHPNRLSIALFVQATQIAQPMIVCLERSKDASGADTGDGLILFYTDYAFGGNYIGPSFSRYLILAGGTQPATELGLSYNLSNNNPSETWLPGDIGAALPFTFKGLAQQPGMNLAIIASNDVSAEGNFSLNIYGRTVNYQHCNGVYVYKTGAGPGTSNTVGDNAARCAIRYD